MSDKNFFKALSKKVEQDIPHNVDERINREIEKRSKKKFSFMMPAVVTACLVIAITSGVLYKESQKQFSFDTMEIAMQQDLLEDLELIVASDTEELDLLELSDEEWEIILEGENA